MATEKKIKPKRMLSHVTFATATKNRIDSFGIKTVKRIRGFASVEASFQSLYSKEQRRAFLQVHRAETEKLGWISAALSGKAQCIPETAAEIDPPEKHVSASKTDPDCKTPPSCVVKTSGPVHVFGFWLSGLGQRGKKMPSL